VRLHRKVVLTLRLPKKITVERVVEPKKISDSIKQMNLVQ
jgi:hypothetical protein